MRRDDAVFLIQDTRRDAKIFKMTKGKTAVFLVMIIFSCGLIFSITDAYPTPDAETTQEDVKVGNNSRLVITHVVKTIEFEVGIIDDDGNVDENATDSNVGEFYETDIQLLNVDLLREVVNQATGDNSSSPQTINEEKTEGQTQQQVQNDTILQLNQTTS